VPISVRGNNLKSKDDAPLVPYREVAMPIDAFCHNADNNKLCSCIDRAFAFSMNLGRGLKRATEN
jgi:hypothetical protein